MDNICSEQKQEVIIVQVEKEPRRPHHHPPCHKHDPPRSKPCEEVKCEEDLEKALLHSLENFERQLREEEHRTTYEMSLVKEESKQKLDHLRELRRQEQIKEKQAEMVCGLIPRLEAVKYILDEEEVLSIRRMREEKEREIQRLEELFEREAELICKVETFKRILVLEKELAIHNERREVRLRKQTVKMIEEIQEKLVLEIAEKQ